MERFLLTFIEQAADAIIAVDNKGVIKYWNKGAERIFGYLKDEAIDKSLDLIIPTNLRERHWERFYEVMDSGVSKYSDSDLLKVPAINKNGDKIFIEFTITIIKDKNNKILYCFSIIRDVTDRKIKG